MSPLNPALDRRYEWTITFDASMALAELRFENRSLGAVAFGRRVEEHTFEQSIRSRVYVTNEPSGAVLGHRDEYSWAPFTEHGCPVRVRLTPSEPYSRGAMWHKGAKRQDTHIHDE